MKRKFEIIDGRLNVLQGYLWYDTDTKEFSMRTADKYIDCDNLFFNVLHKQGIRDVPQHIVDRWIDGRIIPPNRQGLYDILKEMGVTEYDRFTMLKYNDAVCQMDSSYIREIEPK